MVEATADTDEPLCACRTRIDKDRVSNRVLLKLQLRMRGIRGDLIVVRSPPTGFRPGRFERMYRIIGGGKGQGRDKD